VDRRFNGATKLTIPTSVRPVVPRPQLHERLDRGGFRVGVVSAPAGFGKTSLLATWSQSHRESTAWMSCSPADADPTRFWGGLLSAVDGRWPGVADDASVLLERNSAASEDLAVALAGGLSESDDPISIVIDDLHLAPRAPHAFASFVSMLPDNVRLVLGSRVDPALPLGRLRVAGSLMELHTGELSFSTAETAAALELNEVTTDASNVSKLQDLTEGWPAGVQLAMLAMRASSDHAQFLEAFATTDRAVAEFLVSEVLDAQDAELVDFLYTTSVLDEFDAALCEEVTGRADSGALLDRLVADNLFIVRVGDGWYRYHHLFGAFLRARLRSLGTSRWRNTHERAATALETRGDAFAALHQASAGGNPEQAAAILRRTVGRWLNVVNPQASNMVVRAWLNEFGRELIVRDPDQVLEFLVAPVATANPDDSVWWFNQIELTHPNPPPATLMKLQGAWAEHHLARGQPEEALPRAQQAMDARLGVPMVGILAAAPTVLARAHLQLGDEEAAAQVLAATEREPTGHPVTDFVRVPALQAWIALQNAELGEAERRANSALRSAAEWGLGPGDLGRIFADVTLAGIDLERLDDASAHQRLVRAGQGADLAGRAPLHSLVALQQSVLARVCGDEQSAAASLNLARLFFPAASRPVRLTFDLEAAHQAIRFQPSRASDLVNALGEAPAVTLLRIRLALATGEPQAALRLLDQLPPARSLRDRVVRKMVIAIATLDRDVDAATAAFTDALLDAHAQGLKRSVLDLSPDVSRLLKSVTPGQNLVPYVNELIDAGRRVPVARPRPETTLVVPLSEREVTVLRYLCSQLTYQEIAAALYVSLNTLKSHVKSVYRKLGVGSRQQAVEVGRQLRIV
jgi:LuxR family maltose regulon positive regulatory protein